MDVIVFAADFVDGGGVLSFGKATRELRVVQVVRTNEAGSAGQAKNQCQSRQNAIHLPSRPRHRSRRIDRQGTRNARLARPMAGRRTLLCLLPHRCSHYASPLAFSDFRQRQRMTKFALDSSKTAGSSSQLTRTRACVVIHAELMKVLCVPSDLVEPTITIG